MAATPRIWTCCLRTGRWACSRRACVARSRRLPGTSWPRGPGPDRGPCGRLAGRPEGHPEACSPPARMFIPTPPTGSGRSSRQLGKVLVLACGFGMGAEQVSARPRWLRHRAGPAEAEAAVAGWREANANIVSYWWRSYETACCRRAVAAGPMSLPTAGDLPPHKDTLEAELPSGRALVYREPEDRAEPGPPPVTNLPIWAGARRPAVACGRGCAPGRAS
jgi:hypothetical protein